MGEERKVRTYWESTEEGQPHEQDMKAHQAGIPGLARHTFSFEIDRPVGWRGWAVVHDDLGLVQDGDGCTGEVVVASVPPVEEDLMGRR